MVYYYCYYCYRMLLRCIEILPSKIFQNFYVREISSHENFVNSDIIFQMYTPTGPRKSSYKLYRNRIFNFCPTFDAQSFRRNLMIS